jgi:hypothetical protein
MPADDFAKMKCVRDDGITAAIIDTALSDLLELRSRRRVLQYLNAGWILPETADRILKSFDECGA